MNRTLLVGALVLGVGSMPASAQASTLEEQDAYYESCVTEYVNRGMGNIDQASAYCYPRAYGNEGGGGSGTNTGGAGGWTGTGNQCYGTWNNCNPHEKPD